jgi:hypothetical protein
VVAGYPAYWKPLEFTEFKSLFHLVKEMSLTIEEVDKLMPVIGCPKSATLEQLTLLD